MEFKQYDLGDGLLVEFCKEGVLLLDDGGDLIEITRVQWDQLSKFVDSLVEF